MEPFWRVIFPRWKIKQTNCLQFRTVTTMNQKRKVLSILCKTIIWANLRLPKSQQGLLVTLTGCKHWQPRWMAMHCSAAVPIVLWRYGTLKVTSACEPFITRVGNFLIERICFLTLQLLQEPSPTFLFSLLSVGCSFTIPCHWDSNSNPMDHLPMISLWTYPRWCPTSQVEGRREKQRIQDLPATPISMPNTTKHTTRKWSNLMVAPIHHCPLPRSSMIYFAWPLVVVVRVEVPWEIHPIWTHSPMDRCRFDVTPLKVEISDHGPAICAPLLTKSMSNSIASSWTVS